MLSFFIHHILSLKARSFGIFIAIILLSFLFFLSVLIYKNTFALLEYYSLSTIDAKRVTFVSESSIFDIFNKNGGGIPDNRIEEIRNDTLFSRTRIFSFVETNVIGGFDIFAFHFDVDIPVFSLDDSQGSLTGFGISPAMMHYYNLELAGSHPLFPTVDTGFLAGKKVSLTFGASKIFSVTTPPSTPLRGNIVSIDADYPGFGILVPEVQILPKLQELGAELRQPYKIVAYMKDPSSREEIGEKYSGLKMVFDQDILDVREKQFRAIYISIFSIGGFFSSIIMILLVFLFFGYFREKKSVFLLGQIYGLSFTSRNMLFYGEIYILMGVGFIFTTLFMSLFQDFFLQSIGGFFRSHGVLFPLQILSSVEIIYILFLTLFILSGVIFLTSWKS